jgi:hypothetical protein
VNVQIPSPPAFNALLRHALPVIPVIMLIQMDSAPVAATNSQDVWSVTLMVAPNASNNISKKMENALFAVMILKTVCFVMMETLAPNAPVMRFSYKRTNVLPAVALTNSAKPVRLEMPVSPVRTTLIS